MVHSISSIQHKRHFDVNDTGLGGNTAFRGLYVSKDKPEPLQCKNKQFQMPVISARLCPNFSSQILGQVSFLKGGGFTAVKTCRVFLNRYFSYGMEISHLGPVSLISFVKYGVVTYVFWDNTENFLIQFWYTELLLIISLPSILFKQRCLERKVTAEKCSSNWPLCILKYILQQRRKDKLNWSIRSCLWDGCSQPNPLFRLSPRWQAPRWQWLELWIPFCWRRSLYDGENVFSRIKSQSFCLFVEPDAWFLYWNNFTVR